MRSIIVLSLAIVFVSTLADDAIEGNCKQGWLRFENKCYRIFTKSKDHIRDMDFQRATRFCGRQISGSTLVTISSQEEQDFLTAELGQSDVEDAVLIGLKRPDRRLKHEWIDGTKLDFENWVIGKPSKSILSKPGCAQMQNYETTAGQWDDIPCNTEKEFICQSKPGNYITEPQPETERHQCPENWVRYRESCYKVSQQPMSWSNAEEFCMMHDSYLVSIQDSFESAFLKRLLNHQEVDFWIGLRATLSHLELFSDKYRHYLSWSDYRSVQHLEWDEDEPKYLSDQETQCVQLKSNLKWSVADCQEEKKFICVQHNRNFKNYEERKRVEGFCPIWNGFEDKFIDIGKANCYWLNSDINEVKSFDEARQECQKYGGDLAMFATRQEANLLRPYVWRASDHDNYYWVGIRARVGFGDYRTLTCKSIREDMWHEGEPNELKVERCAAIYSQSGKLFNFRCEYNNNYICQVPKVATKEEASAKPSPKTQTETPNIIDHIDDIPGNSQPCHQ